MSRRAASTLKRSPPASDMTSVDSYDQAEKGLQTSVSDGHDFRQPAEPARILSLVPSIQSSDSTLVVLLGETYEPDHQQRVGRTSPLQVPPPQPGTWLPEWINRIRRPPFLRIRPSKPTAEPPEEYKKGYAKFYYEKDGTFPDGWPRLAAFMQSSDSFAIYRKFGYCFGRLLITHMSNLTEMETKLKELDNSDAAGGEDTNWRLKNRWHEEGLDTTKRELEHNMRNELVAYVTLLEKFSFIKSLSPTRARDHDSVFKWIWSNSPLDEGEDDWIFHADDFVHLVPPRRNRFESFILSHLDGGPSSWFKRMFQSNKHLSQAKDAPVKLYSKARISIVARLMAVFFAVVVIFIPVILFFLTSMSRASMTVVVLIFDFIFSVIISLLADAGVQEIFIGTATYCAVLVTFLGNLQGPVSGK